MNTTHSLYINSIRTRKPKTPPVVVELFLEAAVVDQDDEDLKALEQFGERCHNEERKRRAGIIRRNRFLDSEH